MKFDDKFLSDRYDFELARKEKLSDSLGLPVSVLVVLGSLVVTMLRGFSYSRPSITVPFLTAVGFDVLAFGWCLWFFAKAYHGQTYKQLPSLSELNAARQKLVEYYEDNPPPAEMDAETDFEDNLRWRIMEAADQNRKSNNEKMRCTHLAIGWLFALLVATAVTAVPFAVDQIVSPARVPVVHIDNLDQQKGVPMPTQQPTAPTQPRPQPQSTPTAPKPQFPSNELFKNDRPVSTKSDK